MSAAALAWIAGDDTGSSSKAIWAHMMGIEKRGAAADYPRDPDDFGRCYRLLALLPLWRLRIGEMARYGPAWAVLAGAWDELTALWEEEIGPGAERRYGRAPKLYARMKELQDAAHKAVPA